MRGIALNFFPLETDDFTITLYRLPFVEGERPTSGDEEAIRRRLKVNGEYESYWTFFQPATGATEVVCMPFDSIYVTIDALRLALIQSCRDNLASDQFHIIEATSADVWKS